MYRQKMSTIIAEPATVEQANEQLRLEGQDGLVSALISAARDLAENEIHAAIAKQSVVIEFDSFAALTAEHLPVFPILSIDSISYTDTDGNEQTLSTDEYFDTVEYAQLFVHLENSAPEIKPRSTVKITVTAGYESAPAALRQAVISTAIDLYEHPEAQTEYKLSENKTVMRLIGAYKNPVIA